MISKNRYKIFIAIFFYVGVIFLSAIGSGSWWLYNDIFFGLVMFLFLQIFTLSTGVKYVLPVLGIRLFIFLTVLPNMAGTMGFIYGFLRLI